MGSGDPKSSYKGSDKREGAGAGNWGTTENDLKAQTEPTEEKPAVEGAATEEEKAPPAPVEPEEKTLTLEEYYAQRKKSNRNPIASRRGDNRGGRGRGGGRGGNRGSGDRPRNNEAKKTTADFNLESDFPTLG